MAGSRNFTSRPVHHFTIPGIPRGSILARLGNATCTLPCWASFALGMAAGFRYRLCVFAFFLGFTYVELIGQNPTISTTTIGSTLVSFLMLFLPLHRSASVDRWLALRRGREIAVSGWDAIPVAALWVLRGQVAVVYLFAGIAKLNPDWLLEAQPLRIWLHHHTDLPLVGPLMGEPWVAYAMSWTGAFFDLTIIGWLMWGRIRMWAFLVAGVFHLLTWLLFPQIGVFPWLMLGGRFDILSARLAPDGLSFGVRTAGKAVGRSAALESGQPAAPGDAEMAAHGRGHSRWPRFFILQLAVPLRHYLYPGNVRWNEEGYRFSWRVWSLRRPEWSSIGFETLKADGRGGLNRRRT